jgi:hypothetical protein
LLVWRAGDDLSGAGAYASYRFFSHQTVPLQPGQQTLSVTLDPRLWINVWGHTDADGFAAALNNVQYMGFTFGGNYFAGHGVWTTSGSASFKVKNFFMQ